MNENLPFPPPSLRPEAGGAPMTFARAPVTRFVERTVDGEQEFALQDVFEKVKLRKRLIFACIAVATLASLAITLLTPMTWQASTKILIRYSSSESAFLKGLIPDERVTLSGVTSSEIIRSLPTLEEVVGKYDIQPSDLYQSTWRAVASTVTDFYRRFAPAAKMDPEERREKTARQFQDSLLASAALAGGARAAPIEVIGNSTPLPQSVKGDEVITLTVKAFNRAKVAEMTNGLTQAFIDQYYKISAEDGRRSENFLLQLEEEVRAEVQRLERGGDDQPGSSVAATGAGDSAVQQTSPVLSALATELANREAALAKTQQLYQPGSRELEQMKIEVGNLKQLISGDERLEIAKHALERIRERRFETLNTERLYQNRLVPISVIEPATTPAPSKSAQVSRLSSSLVTGLAVGGMFGLAAAIVLAMLDPRIVTPGDLERTLRLPILGWIPRTANAAEVDADHAVAGLAALAGRLLRDAERRPAQVIAIASAANDEGKSFTALLLARLVARETGGSVLVIDADADRATLTRGPLGAANIGDEPSMTLGAADGGVRLAPCPPAERSQSTRFSSWLRHAIADARGGFDLIVIDTPSLDQGPRGYICCEYADVVFLVARRQATTKSRLRHLLHSLREAAVSPAGVILNFADLRN